MNRGHSTRNRTPRLVKGKDVEPTSVPEVSSSQEVPTPGQAPIDPHIFRRGGKCRRREHVGGDPAPIHELVCVMCGYCAWDAEVKCG